MLRQLYFAILDLTLHEEYFPKPGQSFEDTQLFKEVVNKTTVLPPIPGDRCAAVLYLHELCGCPIKFPGVFGCRRADGLQMPPDPTLTSNLLEKRMKLSTGLLACGLEPRC